MYHNTPEVVTQALSKLSPSEKNLVEEYISKLRSEIPHDNNVLLPPSYDMSSNKNDPDKAAEFKQKANNYRSKGDYQLALDNYSLAIQAAPPSSLLLASRAGVLFALKRYKSAIHDCNVALEKNNDCAKALRIRGRSYKMIGEYEKARKDLSTSQTIDYDGTAVEDLKEVMEKVAEKEKKRVQERNEEEKGRMKLEELKKQREKIQKEEKKKPNNTAMPGTGCMSGGLMGSLFNDPEIASSLQNPKVQAAFSSMMSGGGLDMSKIQQCMSDPELAPVFQKLMTKLGPMMGKMGGMGSFAGMDGDSKGDIGISNIDDIPNL